MVPSHNLKNFRYKQTIYLRDCHQASVSTGCNQSTSESPVDRSFIAYTPGFCETAVLTEGFHLPHQCLVRVAETEDVCAE